MNWKALGFLALVCAVACGDDDGGTDAGTDTSVDTNTDTAIDAEEDAGPTGPAESLLDLESGIDSGESFFDIPWPSDMRLDPDGTPDLTGYPLVSGVDLTEGLMILADDRPGYPTNPVASFRFTAPVAPAEYTDVIAASTDSPVLLVDVDPDSPNRGRLIPTVAVAHDSDLYTGDNLLSIAPRPGFILHPEVTYAAIIMTSYNDAEGEPLVVNETLATLAADGTPEGARGAEAAALYAPMWETLDTLGVARTNVAAATVFTTGDVVRQTFELSNRVLEAESVTIDALRLDPLDGRDNPRFCELIGEIDFPQYQVGTPPFNTEGRFDIGDDGLPIEQREETAILHLTIPKEPMPDGGYPIMVYFHGSGGVAPQVVDRGPAPPDGPPAVGRGPAFVVAEHGFAAAGASLPLSPDRLPGASAIEYINLSNLSAFRDTFRQGVIEQRLMIRALQELEISPATLEGCDGPELPAGETSYHFNPEEFVGLGQSMGGMYTNMIGAVEPDLKALVPTGAGGHWSYFILETTLIPGVKNLLAVVLRVREDNLSFLHPVMHLLALGWEAAEPTVYMPRLARRPLDEVPVRPIYEPVAPGDSFFPIQVYDAVVLSYGHPMAGQEVWPSMQDALALDDLDGLIDYPVANNLTNERGEDYTGVVVQFEPDGFSDPHVIFVQLEDVMYQYGCFLKTALDTGVGVVPAPAALGTECPTVPIE